MYVARVNFEAVLDWVVPSEPEVVASVVVAGDDDDAAVVAGGRALYRHDSRWSPRGTLQSPALEYFVPHLERNANNVGNRTKPETNWRHDVDVYSLLAVLNEFGYDLSVLSRMKTHSFFSASQVHSMILWFSSLTSFLSFFISPKGTFKPPTYNSPMVVGNILQKTKEMNRIDESDV